MILILFWLILINLINTFNWSDQYFNWSDQYFQLIWSILQLIWSILQLIWSILSTDLINTSTDLINTFNWFDQLTLISKLSVNCFSLFWMNSFSSLQIIIKVQFISNISTHFFSFFDDSFNLKAFSKRLSGSDSCIAFISFWKC